MITRHRATQLGSVVGGAAAGFAAHSPAGGLVVAVLGLLTGAGWRSRRRRSSLSQSRDALLDLLTGLGLELRGGRPPVTALLAAAAARPRSDGAFPALIGPVLLAAGRGDDVARPLSASSDPGLRALGSAWEVTARTGAPLADVVESLVAGLRADRTLLRERESAMAGPRASAALLAVLPVVGIPLAAGLGAHPTAFLLRDRLGQGCLLAGVALDVIAFGWTRRLTVVA